MTEDFIRQQLIKKFAFLEDNLYNIPRLFTAISILKWAYANKSPNEIKYYISEIEKHLNGEITLYWQDDIVKVRRKNEKKEK